jgi:hypothetical protein
MSTSSYKGNYKGREAILFTDGNVSITNGKGNDITTSSGKWKCDNGKLVMYGFMLGDMKRFS